MQSITGIFLLMLFGYSKSLSNTRCFLDDYRRTLCFTRADPQVALSWSSAMEWCKNIGGTLPTIDDYHQNNLYGNVLGYFGLHMQTLWLGANFTYDQDNWYWTNGSRFIGTFEDNNIRGKTHAYIVRNGTDVKFVAASPTDSRFHICQNSYLSDFQCASYYQESYWTSKKCYIKNTYETTWYNYLSVCGQTGPAIIDNLDDFSRWLDDLETFWIGLHCSRWTWHDAVTGNSYAVMDNRFRNVNDLFNVTTAKCLASYRDNGVVYWANVDCDSNLPFICQYNVNPNPPTDVRAAGTTHINPNITVAAGTTRINPPTVTPIPSTIPNAYVSRTTTYVPNFPTNSPTTASGGEIVASSTQTTTTTTLRNSDSDSKPAIFGLSMECFVGLGGGLFLAVTVWLALLTVCACKKPGGTKIYQE